MNIDICDLQKIKSRLIQECRDGESCNLKILHLDGKLYLYVYVKDAGGLWLRSAILDISIFSLWCNKRIKKITKYFLSTLFDNGV